MLPDRDLSSLVGEFYEAGSGGGDWTAVGARLCGTIHAQSASLSVRQGDGSSLNLLRPVDAEESLYNAYFRAVDPVRPAAEAISPDGDPLSAVRFNDELLSRDAYRESEFYRDFGRHHGQDHMLIGALGDAARTLLVVYRDRTPFGERDRTAFARLLPYARNALALQQRLAVADLAADAGLAALTASASGAVVVDAELNVRFANDVALGMAGAPTSSFVFRPATGSSIGHMVARHRGDHTALKALAADAASGGSGGSLRLRKFTRDSWSGGYDAVLVSPVPPRMGNRGSALVVLRELSRPVAPSPSVLGDLFALSKAEAAVAVAILGGRSAEEVALLRDVSLDTIRSQIRTVLRKSEAANLRDFERIGAVLGAMQADADKLG